MVLKYYMIVGYGFKFFKSWFVKGVNGEFYFLMIIGRRYFFFLVLSVVGLLDIIKEL